MSCGAPLDQQQAISECEKFQSHRPSECLPHSLSSWHFPEVLCIPRLWEIGTKFPLKDIKLSPFMIIIVCLRDALGPSAGLCHCLRVSTEPHLFIRPHGGFKNGPSQMWAFSKCESFSWIFAFSRGSGTWHLFSCPLPPFRNIEFHAFCVSPGQRILHL